MGGIIYIWEKETPSAVGEAWGLKSVACFGESIRGDPMDTIIATNHKHYNQNKKTNYIVTKIISETQGDIRQLSFKIIPYIFPRSILVVLRYLILLCNTS